jgi:hypothetical protein
MTTIRDLAAQTGAQPHEIATYLDLGVSYADTDELTAEQEHLWLCGELR